MDELPKVAIVVATFQRTEYLLRTICGLKEHLVYPRLVWYLGDGGSHADHYQQGLNAMDGLELLGSHTHNLRPGANWNKALRAALEHVDIVLWMEDDFELQRPLFLAPYVKLLCDESSVGMVRLGHLPVNLRCETVGFDGRHYLDILPDRQYRFSGNPHLKHRRFVDAYGWYNENTNPGDTELDYDARCRMRPNPRIWWPVDLGGWGIFGHIGAVPSYGG